MKNKEEERKTYRDRLLGLTKSMNEDWGEEKRFKRLNDKGIKTILQQIVSRDLTFH